MSKNTKIAMTIGGVAILGVVIWQWSTMGFCLSKKCYNDKLKGGYSPNTAQPTGINR